MAVWRSRISRSTSVIGRGGRPSSLNRRAWISRISPAGVSGLKTALTDRGGEKEPLLFPVVQKVPATDGLKRVLDFDLAPSEVADILIEIRRAVGLQPLQRSGEPAFEADTNGCELPFDGDFGEVIHRHPQCLRGQLQVTEGLVVVEMDGKSSAARALSVQPRRRVRWCPGTELNRRHRDFQSRALPTELPGHREPGGSEEAEFWQGPGAESRGRPRRSCPAPAWG